MCNALFRSSVNYCYVWEQACFALNMKSSSRIQRTEWMEWGRERIEAPSREDGREMMYLFPRDLYDLYPLLSLPDCAFLALTNSNTVCVTDFLLSITQMSLPFLFCSCFIVFVIHCLGVPTTVYKVYNR